MAVVGIFVVFYFVEKFFQQYSVYFLIGGIVAIIVFAVYRITLTQRREWQVQQEMDKAANLPPLTLESISGSYKCPSCGAYTSIENELHPSVTCRFCSAAIPTLIDVVRIRDDKYKERCEKRNVWVQGKRQEILAEHQRWVMMDKEKSRQAMHKTVRNLVISIVAIVLCYILLDKILPIAVDRASDSLSHSLDHFTDRLFGH